MVLQNIKKESLHVIWECHTYNYSLCCRL